MKEGAMLTVTQAAIRAGVSLALAYSWLKSGLPHYRFGKKGRGGKIMIDETDLEKWLAGCKVEAAVVVPQPRKPKPSTFRHLRFD
jgi:predicted site-specific integrase-resolvase